MLGIQSQRRRRYCREMPKNARSRRRPSLRELFAAPYVTAAATLSASSAMRILALLTTVNALGNGLFAEE